MTVMRDQRVFVSGGAGVIGLEIVPKLIGRGAKVLVGDLKPRPTAFAGDVCYRQGDLNHITKAELEAFAPTAFIHLAATFERSVESYAFWDENYWHNIRLSHHLMTMLKDLPSLRRVVFASSYLIYDQSLYQFDEAQREAVSLKESDPIIPRNLIGMAKLAHEIELRFLDDFRAEAFSIISARIFRGYGRNSRDVISRWVRSLLAGEPITLYRPEGIFDYIYAGDTAEGLIRLAEAEACKGIVNLGTGRARKVQDVIAVLRRHFPRMVVNQEPSDLAFEASQADMSLYRDRVGWMPEYDLERAIPEIIAHEKEALLAKQAAPLEPGNILVTSAARKIPMLKAVQDAARRLSPAIRVIAGDSDERALSRHVADDFWHMPRIEEAAVKTLLDECRQRGIRTVVPSRDGELAFWAKHRDRFAQEGIDVCVSPLESIEQCLDKLAFAQFGLAHGLPFIQAAIAIEKAGDGPFVVKERYGAGARSIGLGLDRAAAIDHASKLEHPIYQPFVAGREISVDAWLDHHHQVKGVVLRKRDQVESGESQVTTTFRHAGIETAVTHILQMLKLRGPVVMQALIDAQDRIHVIECNTRFGGASTASITAGLDVFHWSMLESVGADVEAIPFDRIPGEIRQVRVPTDMYQHLSGLESNGGQA